MSNKLYTFFFLFVVIALISAWLGFSNSQKKLDLYLANIPDDSSQVLALSQKLNDFETSLKESAKNLDKLNLRLDKLSEISLKDKSYDGSINEYLLAANGTLYQLEDIINATGIMAFATNENIDKSALTDLYKEQFDKKVSKEYRKEMLTLAKDQKAEDISLYGKELSADLNELRKDIYSKLQDDRDSAISMLDDFVSKYPDSYAAGNLIAESTFWGGMEDISDWEDNYAKLMKNEKYMNASHEHWGIKPATFVQRMLTEKYISEKRYDDAEKILKDMEKNPADRTWNSNTGGTSTSADVAKKLREQMNL